MCEGKNEGEMKHLSFKIKTTPEQETLLFLKRELSAVKLWCLVFSVLKMAHVRLLHPSHGVWGGKPNPNPSSFSRAESL